MSYSLTRCVSWCEFFTSESVFSAQIVSSENLFSPNPNLVFQEMRSQSQYQDSSSLDEMLRQRVQRAQTSLVKLNADDTKTITEQSSDILVQENHLKRQRAALAQMMEEASNSESDNDDDSEVDAEDEQDVIKLRLAIPETEKKISGMQDVMKQGMAGREKKRVKLQAKVDKDVFVS